MKKYLLVLMMLSLVGCSPKNEENIKGNAPENPIESVSKNENSTLYLKVAHYFGDAWPINFWSSELYNAEEDMKKIKEDGFNAIILVLPWGEFQPKLNPIQYNGEVISKLQFLIEEAEKQELNVILRLGYTWDFDPDVEFSNTERLREVYLNDEVYKAWLAYMEKMKEVTSGHANVLFGFLTWEDLWGIVEEASLLQTDEQRMELSQKIGFPSYLKENFTLEEISDIYEYKIASWEEVMIPESETEAFKLFYQFVDKLYLEKFYTPAQKVFPNLSMEVRVDSDPIYLENGDIEWHSHKETYALPNAEYTTTYYSPAMGATNLGDEESAKTSLERQEFLFADVKNNSNGNKIFVDQYLYYDNTPNFTLNTKVKAEELDEFIINSADNLKNFTSGYGVWAYKDYAANVLYNPQFEVGLKGWEVAQGKVDIVEVNGDNTLTLEEGSKIIQLLEKDRDFYYKHSESATLWFYAHSSDSSANLAITVGDRVYNEVINERNNKYEIKIPIKALENFDLSFEAQEGNAFIDDIKLFSFVQEAKLYTVEGEEGTALDAIRTLNSKLPEYINDHTVSEFAVNSFSNDTIEESVQIFKNSYPVEGEEGKKFIWLPEYSYINLINQENDSYINIKGFIPFSAHKKVNPILDSLTVTFYINDEKVKEQTFKENSELNELINLTGTKWENEKKLKLGIEVNSEFNLKKSGIGLDERDLSIMINYVKMEIKGSTQPQN